MAREKRQNSITGSFFFAPAVMGIILLFLVGVLAVGYRIWNGYKNTIMDNQKQQLLLTSRTLADNMEIALYEYQQDLSFLCAHQEKSGGFAQTQEFFREYLNAKAGLETDILQVSADGTAESILHTGIELRQPVTDINDTLSVWLAQTPDDRHLFVFLQSLPDGNKLGLAVDADRCYEEWISGVQIGTSGYIMVKNSSGIILMHPQASQWGIHVISGRKERFPDLDLTSLENMVEEQNRGEEGISDYYSYWWLEEPLVRVHKISGYAPVKLGRDFWVISSVVDYDDFSSPIEKGFYRVASLFLVSLMIAVVLLFIVTQLLADRRRSQNEITTLRELNERLETIHRGEERIGHQQRLQVIGTMTGGVAHEFNNLLTPIMGYSELLMLALDKDSEEHEYAQEIYDASDKAKDVVRQLSTLSRRNVETVFKKNEVLPLLKRICKMMRSTCPSDITLEEKYDLTDGDAILCNSTQISQVLLNLCVNAIYAIRSRDNVSGKSGTAGGSDSFAAPEIGRIRLQARVTSRESLLKLPQLAHADIPEDWGRYLQIRIADNGCGMSKEVLKQIFTPFFTTKKAGEGTGLGLSLVEQIILSHRGFIFAESTPGRGSVFTILLPLMDIRDTAQVSFGESAKGQHILIADDNAKILDMLSRGFSKLGVDAEVCRTHEELKTLLKEYKGSVMLIDESLEDGSGIDFCMSIQGTYPAIIKIVMADYPTDNLLEAKQHNIIDGYLLKPVSCADALEEIRRCSEQIH
ncbi:MAG: response regulator [Lachnospiraceae bacterium]|nr:response regulator [Lachnospiraceae bacterium]